MMISRGGLVLKIFLDRFRVLKKDHENKFKDVNPGRKDLGIEQVDDNSNAEENVRNEDSLIQVPKRWNTRTGSEAQKWVDFKAEWNDYLASGGLSGLNEFESKYMLLNQLGCYDAQAYMLKEDKDNKYANWKMVMEKLDDFFLSRSREVDENNRREKLSISRENETGNSLTSVKKKDV